MTGSVWLTFIVLILTLLIIINIAISTLRLGISPMPSNRSMRRACVQLVSDIVCTSGQSSPVIIIAGAGWGGLAMTIAKGVPQCRILAYEAALVPYLCCLLQQRFRRSAGQQQVQFIRRNVLRTHLPEEAIVVAYLYPTGIQQLYEHIKRQSPQLSGLVSIAFAVNRQSAHTTLKASDWMHTPVYWYPVT